MIMNNNMNPEALHDVGQNTSMQVNPAFVNPGTPASPLVTADQMTKATISGNGSEVLRANLIK